MSTVLVGELRRGAAGADPCSPGRPRAAGAWPEPPAKGPWQQPWPSAHRSGQPCSWLQFGAGPVSPGAPTAWD